MQIPYAPDHKVILGRSKTMLFSGLFWFLVFIAVLLLSGHRSAMEFRKFAYILGPFGLATLLLCAAYAGDRIIATRDGITRQYFGWVLQSLRWDEVRSLSLRERGRTGGNTFGRSSVPTLDLVFETTGGRRLKVNLGMEGWPSFASACLCYLPSEAKAASPEAMSVLETRANQV